MLDRETPIPPRADARIRAIIDEEVGALLTALPAARSRQWTASPVPRPREDTTERSHGGPPPNPTADLVLDPRRLALREAVVRAEHTLIALATRLADARRDLERATAAFDGAEDEPE